MLPRVPVPPATTTAAAISAAQAVPADSARAESWNKAAQASHAASSIRS